VARFISCTMASSGLEITMTKQSGACTLRFSATLRMMRQVDPQQIVARHAGFAGDARGHDGHVAAARSSQWTFP